MPKNSRISFILLVLFFAFSCNYSGELLSEEDKSYYNQIGQETVQHAGQKLLHQLSTALQEGGIEGAIPFCKMNADSIIASMQNSDQVKSIRRTSMKFRNKKNKPSERDKTIFKVYEYATKRGDSLKPILQTDPKKHEVVYYSPIMVKETCLICHGNKDNGYTRSTFDIINKYYPKDKAFNYNLGDMRGMWVVYLNERTK